MPNFRMIDRIVRKKHVGKFYPLPRFFPVFENPKTDYYMVEMGEYFSDGLIFDVMVRSFFKTICRCLINLFQITRTGDK